MAITDFLRSSQRNIWNFLVRHPRYERIINNYLSLLADFKNIQEKVREVGNSIVKFQHIVTEIRFAIFVHKLISSIGYGDHARFAFCSGQGPDIRIDLADITIYLEVRDIEVANPEDEVPDAED